MKHLFASCAVIALMAAPALAQSTNDSTDPLVQTPEDLDPTKRDTAEQPTDFETGLPETEETITQAESAEDDTETADAETEVEADPVLEADAQETDADTGMDNSDMDVAEAEATFGTEAVDTPLNVADLPDEYSSEDLNAMMLAQLNVVGDEIADANAAAGTNVYASSDTSTSSSMETGSNSWATAQTAPEESTEDYAATETNTDTASVDDGMAEDEMTQDYAGTEMESADPVTDDATTEGYASSEMTADPSTPADESVTQDYAASETGSNSWAPAQEESSEDYAAAETGDDTMVSPSADDAMTPVAPGLEAADETGMLAEEADESVQMAEQSGEAFVTAEGDIDQSAADIAAGDARFSTLIELVGTAGLEDALSEDGSFTVFAPTNDAFAALPEETLAHLKSEEGKAELTEILKSHVVEGAVLLGDVPLAGQSVETLGDASLQVTGSTDGTLNVQGSNTIGDGIIASNGVVYAIDAVILPEATPVDAETGTEG